MTIQTISVGAAPNDGNGDSIRAAMGKINANFSLIASRTNVSPLDYGAAGDGSTNDAAAFQDAIDAAVLAGGVCDLGAKTYRVDSQINLPSGIVIQNGTVDFRNAAQYAKLFVAAGTLGSGVTLTGANRGSTSFSVSSASGMAINDWLYLRSLDAFGQGGTARGEWVRIRNLVGTTVTPYGRVDDTYTSSATAFKPTLKQDITLRNLVLIGRGNNYDQYAGQFYLCRNVRIEGVRAEFFGDRMFELNRSIDCFVSNCALAHADTSTGLAYGVVVANGCARVAVVNSGCMDMRHGVAVGGEDGVDRYVSVVGCAFSEMTDSGIDAHPQSQYVTFTGNTIGADGTAASQDGITMQGANMVCVGNVVMGFERIGILMQNLVTDTSITDNNHLVSGNMVTRPLGTGTVYGIVVENQSPINLFRCVVTGNTVDVVNVNTSYGLLIQNSTSAGSITGVSITGNSVYARRESLTLQTASGTFMRSIAVSGNSFETIDTTSYDCLALLSGSTPNFLERAIIVGNSLHGGRYGVRNSDATRIKVDANMMQGFGTSATTGTLVGTNDNYSS